MKIVARPQSRDQVCITRACSGDLRLKIENSRVVVIYNEVPADAKSDEADVLEQVCEVSKSLRELGYEPSLLPLTLDLERARLTLMEQRPQFAFNLVESLNNQGELSILGPALLNSLRIPYTGGGLNCMFQTTNKVFTKRQFIYSNIPTPAYFQLSAGKSLSQSLYQKLDSDKKYILKPISEDGSCGLDEDSVFSLAILDTMDEKCRGQESLYFVEEYIEGREFNISLLASPLGPQVLPAAEILFEGYGDHKPKVVGYKAKWDENSYEFKNTSRSFSAAMSSDLLTTLIEVSKKCYHVFELRGYARVDIRIDQNNVPQVLEINCNPCIAKDAGFSAACNVAGISYREMVKRIIDDI